MQPNRFGSGDPLESQLPITPSQVPVPQSATCSLDKQQPSNNLTYIPQKRYLKTKRCLLYRCRHAPCCLYHSTGTTKILGHVLAGRSHPKSPVVVNLNFALCQVLMCTDTKSGAATPYIKKSWMETRSRQIHMKP